MAVAHDKKERRSKERHGEQGIYREWENDFLSSKERPFPTCPLVVT